jgi:hypothetical protein
MLIHGGMLVSLLWLVEQLPTPPPPVNRKRGRQESYADKLFIKALIARIIQRLSTAYALFRFLEQDEPVAQQIRPVLTELLAARSATVLMVPSSPPAWARAVQSGWLGSAARRRPVASPTPRVHSRRDCGTIAFAIPIRQEVT